MRTLLFFALSSLILAGCRTDNSTRGGGVAAGGVKNVKFEFINLEKSRKVIYGDSLLFRFEFDAPENLAKASVMVDNRKLNISEVKSGVYYISTTELGGGYHSLRAQVVLADSTVLKGSGTVSVVLAEEPPTLGYRLIKAYPHDNQSYTQGLLWHDGKLIESAGLYARSDIRQVNPEDGSIIKKVRVDDMYFAEGIALYNNELFQLTWREKVALVYNPYNLDQKRTFGYAVGNGEGWGLTHDGEHFIFSDGSANLYFLNSNDWSIERQVRVFDNRNEVNQLNELEFVDGKIYANILNDTRIAIINPATGAVEAYWQLEALLKEPGMKEGRLDVMNGIAYRPDRKSFYVTGKLWPRMFEVVPVTI